jgi:uncharacterized membrane protein YphA (DoxX/SURF4 family)
MNIGFLIGRVVVGLYYLYSGIMGFVNLDTMAGYAAAKGTPAATLAVLVSHALLLIAGFCILTGYKPFAAVAALVLFFVPVTFMMHAFWAEPAASQMNQMVHFTKNLALLGSTLMFLAIPRPWPYSIENFQMRRRIRTPLPA